MMDIVSSIAPLRSSLPDDILITCESFEDRCTRSVSLLDNYKTRLFMIVSFVSRTRNPRGEAKRKINMTDMLTTVSQKEVGVAPCRVKIDPYNPLDLLLALNTQLSERNINISGAAVTVDISCFTKIQLLFLLRVLCKTVDDGMIRLVYTSPSYYASQDRRNLAIGYDRLMIVPYEEPREIRSKNKGVAMVILLGHEGSRTMHAWTEIEPDETVLVHSEDNLELKGITRKQNEGLFSRAEGGAPDIKIRSCATRDFQSGMKLFESLNSEYRKKGFCKMAFVPMGSKPLTAAFALSASNNGHLPIEIVYPVPQAYDPNYSVGTGFTYSYIWQKEKTGSVTEILMRD